MNSLTIYQHMKYWLYKMTNKKINHNNNDNMMYMFFGIVAIILLVITGLLL